MPYLCLQPRKSIYLQNHQTEMDWLYAQYIYQAFGKEGCFSAIMKGSLGYVFDAVFYLVRFLSLVMHCEMCTCACWIGIGRQTVSTLTRSSRTTYLQSILSLYCSVPKAPPSRARTTSVLSSMRRRQVVHV